MKWQIRLSFGTERLAFPGGTQNTSRMAKPRKTGRRDTNPAKQNRPSLPMSRDAILLNPEESRAVAELLVNPPAPNAALLKAAREHRRSVETDK
jgi:hypothetical protein